MAEQLDLYSDDESRVRVFTVEAAEAYGIKNLAARQKMDERTLRNQVDHRRRADKPNSFWKMNEDTFLVLLTDPTSIGRTYREQILSVRDEKIEDVEALEPEDALRDIHTLALAGEFGNAGRERVETLLRRVKKPRR